MWSSCVTAVSLLPCFSARNFPYGTIKITPCDRCPVGWNITQNCKCTDGKWILKFECGGPKGSQVTLEATKLSDPGVISKTCPTITYTTSSFLLSVQPETGKKSKRHSIFSYWQNISHNTYRQINSASTKSEVPHQFLKSPAAPCGFIVLFPAGCVKISGGNNICRGCKFSPPSKAIHCISG